MYWPSCCADSQYVHAVFDGAFCSLDGILATYGDWKDISQWPQCRERIPPPEDAWQAGGSHGQNGV